MLLSKRRLLTVLLICVSASTYAQVRMITYYGDTLKGNVKTMTEYTSQGGFPITKGVYNYDTAQRLEVAHLSIEDEDKVFGTWAVKFDNKGRVTGTFLYHGSDSLCQEFTRTYNTQGNKAEQRFFKYYSEPCKALYQWLSGTICNWAIGDDSVVTLARYEYDQSGLLKKKIIQYTRGNEYDGDKTIQNFSYESKNGRKQEMKGQNIHISLGVADTIVELRTYKYDNTNKLAEVKKATYPLWPPHTDTLVETLDSDYETDDNSLGGGPPFDETEDEKEYDKQGNLIKITRGKEVVFKRDIIYY